MGSHVQNYIMLCNVLAVFWLCSPLVLKQVGTPCWGQRWWDTRKGTGATLGAMLGSKGHDMRHADRHAACSVHGLPTHEQRHARHPNGSMSIILSAWIPCTCLALKGGNTGRYHLQIYFSIQLIPFHFAVVFFSRSEPFYFDEISFVYSFLFIN